MWTNTFIFLTALLIAYPVIGSDVVDNQGDQALVSKVMDIVAKQENLSGEELTEILHDVQIRVNKDKVNSKIVRAWYFPTQELVQDYGYENIYFNGHADKVKVTNAVVVSPSGTQTWLTESNAKVIDSDSYNVFTEGKELILTYPSLEKGGIAIVEYERVRDLNKLEGNWSTVFYPQNMSEKRVFNLDVSWSADKSVHFSSTSEFVDCASRTHGFSCQAQNIPVAAKDYSVVWRDVLGQIVISDSDDWDNVIDKVNKGFVKARNNNTDVIKHVRTLVQGKYSVQDKITAIHEFVARDIRYVSMSESGHAIVPHDVDTTLSNRFGDCKDKSALLLEMLEQIGVSAEPVLIATERTDAKNLGIASMGYFDHVIVCFELSGVKHCIDATDSNTDWRVISSWVQGKVSLALTPGSRPQQLKYSPNRWKLEVDTKIVLNEEGGQTEHQSVLYKGEYASEVRAKLARHNEEDKARWAKDVYNEVVTANSTPDFTFDGVHDISSDIIITSEVSFPPYFSPDQNLHITEKDAWVRYELRTAKQKNDHYDAFYTGTHVISNTVLDVPEKWNLRSLPPELDLQTEFGQLKRKVKVIEEQRIEVRTELILPARSLSVDQIVTFNKILDLLLAESDLDLTGNLVI